MRRRLSLPLALAAVLGCGSTAAYARDGDEEWKLLPAAGVEYEFLGLAVDVHDGTALVAGWGEASVMLVPGVAYLFDAGTGQEIARLQPLQVTAYDAYGASVALAAGKAFVGAPLDSEGGTYAGAVYVFDATTGQQLDKLFASDGAAPNYFGSSLASDGDRVLVGAVAGGAAYLLDAQSEQELLRLTPADGPITNGFGFSVGLSATRVLVGASGDDEAGANAGAAYLFDASTGQQLAKLFASDAADQDNFGGSVALGPSSAVIGAPSNDDPALSSGAAYLFDPTTGQELTKLLRNDNPGFQYFGGSVAIHGATAVVGAHGDGPNAGAYYAFDLNTAQQVGKLRASDGAQSDFLGRSIAIEGATVVVGAPQDDDNGFASGSAYVFDLTLGLAVPYCFGDGSGAPCPCANRGARARGCANSAFVEGTRLFVTGPACVGADDLVLYVRSSRPGQPGLFLQGDQAVGGGEGVAFGDGLRCAGRNVVRLQVRTASPSGFCSSTVPIASTGGVSPGDVKRYQWWYRDPGASPCGTEFNLSNGLEVSWAP